MTREERLQIESEVYAWTADQFDIKLAFKKGAEWERKRLIGKACSWLISSLSKLRSEYGRHLVFVNKSDFIESFKKAMEE